MLGTGINLTLKLGEQKPEPAPRLLVEALITVEVTHSDEERSGFQIVFQVGRSGSPDLKDDPLLKNPLLKPGNRAILILTFNASAQVLMDGIITHQQFSPSIIPGQSTFTITGEDVSIMMDRKESPIEHPAQDEKIIVEQLLANYTSKYGLIPRVEKPPLKAPSIQERIPVKRGTDLAYIQLLAQRHAYVFYISFEPTSEPTSKKNTAYRGPTAYWGPPKHPGHPEPQKALTVNMGAYTNVESLNFQHNALAPTKVSGRVQDRKTNSIRSLDISKSQRPSLAKTPSLNNESLARQMQFRESGHLLTRASILAQAMTDRSVDRAVTVTGDLDTVRYGALLQIRRLVGLRGVGYGYDGLYYVRSVTHRIRPGEYKQSFSITREGVNTTIERLPV